MLGDAFWAEYFGSYDILLRAIPYRDLHEKLDDTLALPSGALVLDAGSGTGNSAMILANRHWRIVGLDRNRVGLRLMRKKLNCSLAVNADLRGALPFSDETFYGVMSANVLYDLSRPLRPDAVRESYRALKPGGSIVLLNVLQGFRAPLVFTEHLRLSVARRGFAGAFLEAVRFVRSTLKLISMNRQIGRADGDLFLRPGEHRSLLSEAGFVAISREVPVYVDQAVVCGARRPLVVSL